MRTEWTAGATRSSQRPPRSAARLLRRALAAAALLAGASLGASGQSAQPVPVYRFVPGASVAYRIAYASRANADLRVLFQGQQSAPPSSNLAYALHASLQGLLRATTLRVAGGQAELFIVFQDPAVQLIVNGQLQEAQAGEVLRELKRGFLVELTPQGRPVALRMQEGASKFSQDFTLTLLAALQVVLPDARAANRQSWTIREEDRNGAYLAHYRIIQKEAGSETSGGIELRKSKLRYLPEKEKAAEPEMPGRENAKKVVTPKMNFSVHFDAVNGEVASLQGTESQETEIQGKKVAHAETMLSLRRESRQSMLAEELEILFQLADKIRKNSPALALYRPRTRAEIEAGIQSTELGEATLQDLLAQLAALPSESRESDKQEADELPLYLKFKALIYLHPEDCAELGKALGEAPATSATYRVLSAALGAVGNPEAQSALIHAIRSRSADDKALPELIATLGTVPHPTEEAEKAMRELAATAANPNATGGALLALGSMARNLSQKEPKRSEELVNTLLQLGHEPGASDEKIQHVLQALGNTASSSGFPFLKQCLGSATPGVRAAALDGMRALKLPEVDPLLLTALATDAEPMVRREAVFALGFRQPSRASVDAQTKAFAAESDDKVRAGILSNLAKMHAQFPEVREVIATAAEKDESEYVRKTSAGLLLKLSPASPSKPNTKP